MLKQSMAAGSDIQNWFRQIRKSGAAMTQGALWLGGMLGTFLLPPPVGVSGGDEKIWLRLGQFIIAVLLGLIFFTAQRWSQPKHAFKWCGVGTICLVLAVAAFFRYQQLMFAWTVNYVQDKVVTGSVFTPQGKSYAEENPELARDQLVFDFKGVTENIWTRESINRRRLILAATYVSCLPLFTLCLIAVVQATQCGVRLPKRRRSQKTNA